MATLDDAVARSLGAVLFAGLGLVHFMEIPHGFAIEPYMGVILILGLLMTLGGLAGMLLERRDRIWWYALAEGVLHAVGYLYVRFLGMPLIRPEGDWNGRAGLAMLFCSLLLSGLAVRALLERRHARRSSYPVTSAHERLLRHIPRPKVPRD